MDTLMEMLKQQDRVVEVEIPANEIPALLHAACIGLWSGQLTNDEAMQGKWARNRIGQAYAAYQKYLDEEEPK